MNMYYNCTKTNPSIDACAVPYSCCKKEDNVQVIDYCFIA